MTNSNRPDHPQPCSLIARRRSSGWGVLTTDLQLPDVVKVALDDGLRCELLLKEIARVIPAILQELEQETSDRDQIIGVLTELQSRCAQAVENGYPYFSTKP